jgi:hypothetical protein
VSNASHIIHVVTDAKIGPRRLPFHMSAVHPGAVVGGDILEELTGVMILRVEF